MKKAFFISDLHLGASYHKDERALERGIVSFLDSIRHEAAEIYLLGDILDYWFEYRHVVPRGYVRFFGKLAELSDSGVKITWLIGNHDIWIFDYIPQELGVEVVDGILERDVLGVTFCMQHGDAIGGDFKFRFLRTLFRNRFCQKLYSGIHPRWTVGFAHGCSNRSRMGKRKKKTCSKERNQLMKKEGGLIVDIREWCIRQTEEGNQARFFVFGHLHRLHDEPLPAGRRLIVIPDWPSSLAYGEFDGMNFNIKHYYLP